MKYDIRRDYLQDSLIKGLEAKEIANEIGCSVHLIRKKIKEFSLKKDVITGLRKNIVKGYWEQGLQDKTISEKTGISESIILRCRKSLNLRGIYKEYKDFPLNSFAYKALVGSLLGDGSLAVGKGVNAYLNYAHSIAQEDYFFHKQNLWRGILKSYKYYENLDSRTEKVYKKYTTFSETHPILTSLYNLLYSTGKKEITKNYMKDFDLISLSYLIMDDGSKNIISTNSFSEESINILIDWIKENLGVTGKRTCQNIIYFTIEEYKKLSKLVEPFIIESMKYKLIL